MADITSKVQALHGKPSEDKELEFLGFKCLGCVQVRAIVEGQFVAMRAHAERIGLPCPPERVIATGGGSTNKHLLALIASVFGCDVYTANCPGKSMRTFLSSIHPHCNMNTSKIWC